MQCTVSRVTACRLHPPACAAGATPAAAAGRRHARQRGDAAQRRRRRGGMEGACGWEWWLRRQAGRAAPTHTAGPPCCSSFPLSPMFSIFNHTHRPSLVPTRWCCAAPWPPRCRPSCGGGLQRGGQGRRGFGVATIHANLASSGIAAPPPAPTHARTPPPTPPSSKVDAVVMTVPQAKGLEFNGAPAGAVPDQHRQGLRSRDPILCRVGCRWRRRGAAAGCLLVKPTARACISLDVGCHAPAALHLPPQPADVFILDFFADSPWWASTHGQAASWFGWFA